MKIIEKDFFGGLDLFVAETGDALELKAAEDVCFPGDPWSVSIFEQSLRDPVYKIYVLKDMQTPKILAYCVMSYCPPEAELINIATVPEARGQGIGKAILSKIIAECQEKEVEQVFLEVRESNEAARALYENGGFEIIGKRRNYYKSPREDAVLMCLDIE